MRKIRQMDEQNSVLLTIPQACQRYQIGESTVRRLCKENGAAVKIGKSLRVHAGRMDEAILKLYTISE